MAVKRYFSNTTETDATFTPPATPLWDQTFSTEVLDLSAAPSGVAASSGSVTETASTSGWWVLSKRYLSDPFLSAGSFGGAFNAVIAFNESVSTADLFLRLVFRVVSADGATERGRYDYISATEMPTTLTGVAVSGTIPTITGGLVGDHLLIEQGFSAMNVTATSVNAVFRRGGTVDMVAGDTGANATSRAGWINFTDALADARFAAPAATYPPGNMFGAYA